MKKLCLILTVLYAIWANCSAQSLNIARNLLEGNSSTFESGMGSWTCNDNNVCSIASESGRNGNYLKLTNTGAVNDYDKQMEYSLSGHTPTKGTRYVIKFWAKRNGNSGKGQIKVLLQKNDENAKWPQQEFSNNPFTVSNDWKYYEFDITANRGDYQVIKINFGDCGEVWIDDIEFGVKTDNVARTINVDGKTREYWLYVPASVEGHKNVPVVFSLHGRYGNDNPNDQNDILRKDGKPIFTSLADKEGFIVVYPQGRNGGSEQDKKDYPGDWYKAFGGGTGWEATGKENADTKFIKAIVDEIKTIYNSNSNISVDPKRFYLCGFSMGGMMTYACAKVLNGTFAAYGSCSGYPLNEFHMNLATEKPIPFIHLHGNHDQILGIKHLNTIIENLLFRNGCDLSKQVINTGWSTTKENGEELNFKKYDFIGVEGVPVTTVTFDGLWHNIEASAPAYLWNFFKDKTTDMYKSDIEWKWDMPTINANITHSSSPSYYGWKHEVNSKNWSLTYGGGGKTECSIHNCSSADPNCTGNHNVYNSIQLTPGKHTLYAKMTSTSGESSVTLRNILTGAETVARKVIDNSGTHDHTNFNVLYEFEVGEGAEFSLELKFSDSNSACNLLEIHKGSYRPQGVKDESQDNASINLTDGKLAELTFENGNNAVDIYPLTSGYGTDLTSVDGNMKLYLKSRLGIKNGEIDNKAKYIVKDAVFGHYFQNIPDADIYDRYGASDYMRVVLGEKNSLSGHDGIDGIQKTGKVTIGFWVNGDLAVNRGLAYDEPSMFYIAGDTYKGPNPDQNNGEYNPHMFNITCSGGLTGYMNDGKFQYNSGTSSFGELCDTKSNADFYNKNFYKDCNWHYITYQMYDNLSRFNMYVDGEPTCLGGYATHNAGSLEECIQGLKSIVLGGANANNVEFGYDVAFAYDDIVIYNRVLSKREINTIIENKKYSPSVWHFDRNLENNIFCNRDLLNTNMWASSDGVYTLNTNFSSAAALTYDGITEIPAFKGLRFVTNGKQIQIDAKSGALRLSQGVKVVFSNLVEGTYVRMEYKDDNVNWNNPELKNVTISGNTPSPSQGCVRTLFKVGGTTSEETSITMPSDINIIRMEATNKNFAQIKFVDNNNEEVSVVTNPNNENPLPRKELYVNGVIDNTSYDFKYTSSSPHVASIDDQGNVTLHGIAGSTVITAELINDANKYDCDIYDQYAFEPSNRIFSSYEIVVTPDPNTSCRVEDNKEYTVGQTLYNGDKTVGVTLGGWTYNNGTYYGNTDSYTAKEPWEGHKFEKNADRNGYLANSRKTEEDVFHEFFNDAHATFSTNGSCAAKSEQLKVEGDNTYAATGNYSAPTNNTSVANKTPWLLPCRGSHIKIEPTDAGLISVYVMQEGCVSHDKEDEPIDVTVKKVYVADEKGEIVKEVVADTKSKVAAQMWKDDGRARAEYRWNDSRFAYNTATMNSFLKINDFNTQWSFLDNWPNPGMQQHVFKLGNDEDGHVLITKGIVRYTFNVLPGKTYYIFSNTAKLGLAGFTFKKGIHAEYHKVKPDAKHDEWRATGEFVDVSKVKDVVLEDGKDYSAPTDAANANVTLNRTFYKNRWNAICLPYSINRRQIEEVFGDGTMVVLMKNIDTSNKKVMFIEHANQDIIAGYPYLIFPTTKDDKGKTNHDPITGITTRATFGEADSPLFSVGTDGNTYPFTEPMQSDALVFKGTFTNATLNEGSYVVTNKGVLSRIPKDKDGMKIRPYRSYIYFNRQTAGAKAISLQSMNVNGFENDEDNTTGIENLLFESGILTHSADVYSIDGQLVRSKALNFNGLPKGVYIVNGKKYVKK
jgi:CHU large protein; esterase-related protein, CBM9 module, carbohydrate esterase family 1 protein